MHAEPREIELLAPARDTAVARAAILHGADAVYIGPSAFGARAAAGNSTEEIRSLCDFAHRFRARVYATVNTIIYEHELNAAERLIWELYHAGIDAIIVQDMGILRLNLPPIALHASTQCDTRTPQKAKFLQDVGFSQIVLARELTLPQIKEICQTVSVPVECFVHGALCVSYSGRCHASYAICGRSANRGECAQLCRLPYELRDADNRLLADPQHLLCLRDFNATPCLQEMLETGVSSFKIEGRLKDIGYVKNVAAHYRRELDKIISAEPEKYRRFSFGETKLNFEPNLRKSFNRGFTTYFLQSRRQANITSLQTPKSLGEPVNSKTDIHAGDGLSYFNPKGEYTGLRVNKVENGRIIPAKGKMPHGVELFRTLDYQFAKKLERNDTAERLLDIEVELYDNRVMCHDERGCRVVLPLDVPREVAKKQFDPRGAFEKLGGTGYRLRKFDNYLSPQLFIPISALTRVRREVIVALDACAVATTPRYLRLPEKKDSKYPENVLSFADNVANSLAKSFYMDHGATDVPMALESAPSRAIQPGTTLMTTRHCILRELGICKKTSGRKFHEPMRLINPGGATFTLRFDCEHCEMQLLK